jgi:small subunit ribosomal protein S21
MLPVIVRDNNVEKALKVFKKLNQRNGLSKELRKRRAYMKPSEKKQKKKSEAYRRLQKNLRKRFMLEGY